MPADHVYTVMRPAPIYLTPRRVCERLYWLKITVCHTRTMCKNLSFHSAMVLHTSTYVSSIEYMYAEMCVHSSKQSLLMFADISHAYWQRIYTHIHVHIRMRTDYNAWPIATRIFIQRFQQYIDLFMHTAIAVSSRRQHMMGELLMYEQ